MLCRKISGRDISAPEGLPMKVDIPLVVLAGGFGTRIRPSIGETAKILAPIGDQTLLHFQMEIWLGMGVRHFLFVLHYKADDVKSEVESIRASSDVDFKVEYTVEPVPLGTGGGINVAVQDGSLNGDFLVINGDTCLDGGFDQVLSEQSPVLLLTEVDNVGRYGEVVLSEDGRIVDFLEKQSEKTGEGLIYAGLSKLNSDFFAFDASKPVSLEHELFPSLVKAQLLSGTVFTGGFIDIGVPDDYQRYLNQKTQT